jgi:branched-chain amino acid transport system permease protein
MRSLFGPIIGATFMTILPELLRGYVEMQHVIFGLILIAVMAAMPGGVVDAFNRVRQFLSRRTRGGTLDSDLPRVVARQ